jgi:MoxR-like ATPase
MLKTLAIGIRDNMPIILVGESGTGKTSAIRYLAGETQNGLRRVNLNGGTTADELIGRLLINEKGTYWVDGVLTEAMRKGEWIVLDEINAALPEVLFVLQSIMDDDGYLVLNEKDDKEIVKKHTNFRLFATCNPPEYAGTKEMNKALLSRFGICINADFPPAAKELEIIEYHLGNAIAKSELALKLVTMANETRQSKEAGNSEYAINTRDVLHTLKLAEFVDPTEALSLAFANKLDPIDNKAIKSLARLHLPSSKKAASATREKIKSAKDLIIGNNFVLDADMQDIYLGLQSVTTPIEELSEKNLGEIVVECNKETGVKGDAFIVEATYYEEGNTGAETKETDTLGEKAASIVKFITGANKNKRAVILHHKDLEDSLTVIENLYEIK